MALWYCRVSGIREGAAKEFGPISSATLRQWVSEQRLSPTDMVKSASSTSLATNVFIILVLVMPGYGADPSANPGVAPLAGALGSMTVVKVGDFYHMYYEAWGDQGTGGLDYYSLQIGHAVSPDGSHFVKKGQISRLGNVEDIHVVHDTAKARYYLYYWDRRREPLGLLRAESCNETDFDFGRAAPIKIEGEKYPGMYKFSHVFLDGGAWYMYYKGISIGEVAISWRRSILGA